MDVSKRVLIVDDLMITRTIMQNFCMEIGFANIEIAKDGQAAWDVIETSKEQFDLIICDTDMPNMTGIELLEKLRNNEKTASITFILLAEEAERKSIEANMKNKVDGYIMKPFSKEILLNYL